MIENTNGTVQVIKNKSSGLMRVQAHAGSKTYILSGWVLLGLDSGYGPETLLGRAEIPNQAQ